MFYFNKENILFVTNYTFKSLGYKKASLRFIGEKPLIFFIIRHVII